jgi:hypothetical protein
MTPRAAIQTEIGAPFKSQVNERAASHPGLLTWPNAKNTSRREGAEPVVPRSELLYCSRGDWEWQERATDSEALAKKRSSTSRIYAPTGELELPPSEPAVVVRSSALSGMGIAVLAGRAVKPGA